jgi:hypothetical protein
MKKGTIVALGVGALALGALAGVAGQRLYDAARFSTPGDVSSYAEGAEKTGQHSGMLIGAYASRKYFTEVGQVSEVAVRETLPKETDDIDCAVAKANAPDLLVSASQVERGDGFVVTCASAFAGPETISITSDAYPGDLAVSLSFYFSGAIASA